MVSSRHRGFERELRLAQFPAVLVLLASKAVVPLLYIDLDTTFGRNRAVSLAGENGEGFALGGPIRPQ